MFCVNKADKLNSCKRLDLVINKHALYILQLINVLCSQDQNVRQSLQREEIKYIHKLITSVHPWLFEHNIIHCCFGCVLNGSILF